MTQNMNGILLGGGGSGKFLAFQIKGLICAAPVASVLNGDVDLKEDAVAI